MMRWLALVAGIALIILAFLAVTRVADTREGLIAEVITLLAGAAGLVLAIFGLAARQRPRSSAAAPAPPGTGFASRERSPRDLVLGSGGVVLSAVLITGLALSGGFLWAGLGLLLLLPMLAGSVYLCWRSLRTNQ